jgi:Spy/CpxP family protein refolding chaperone
MKALVKKSIVLVLVCLFTLTVSAQRADRNSRMTSEDRASRQTEVMTKHLELTEEQQAKIKEINLRHSQQEAVNRDEQGNRGEGRRAQMEARDAEYQQVLTPEQFEKWQEKRSEMGRGQGGQGRGAERSRGPRNNSESPGKLEK